MTQTHTNKAGRRPKEIDPAGGPWHRYCHKLRQLKIDAQDPTFAALAEKIGYISPNTLSRAVSVPNTAEGKELRPGPWRHIKPYVEALGRIIHDDEIDVQRLLLEFEEDYSRTIRELAEAHAPARRPDDSRPHLVKSGRESSNRGTGGVLCLALVALLAILLPGFLQSNESCARESSACTGRWARVSVSQSHGDPVTLHEQPRADSELLQTFSRGDAVRVSCIFVDPDLERVYEHNWVEVDRAGKELQNVLGTDPSMASLAGSSDSYIAKQVRYDNLYNKLRATKSELADSAWLRVDTIYSPTRATRAAATGWVSARRLQPVAPDRFRAGLCR
jgi:hypothetical protein